jgi:hypothetical protein
VKFSNLNNELKSEFFFLTGLLKLKCESNQHNASKATGSSNKLDFLQEEVNEFEAIFISSENGGDSKLSNDKLAALFCLTKANVLSKPNNQLEHSAESSRSDDSTGQDLIRLIQRDCCWRYSIVGNWIRFVVKKHYANDQIEFLKHMDQFSTSTNVIYFCKNLTEERLPFPIMPDKKANVNKNSRNPNKIPGNSCTVMPCEDMRHQSLNSSI